MIFNIYMTFFFPGKGALDQKINTSLMSVCSVYSLKICITAENLDIISVTSPIDF